MNVDELAFSVFSDLSWAPQEFTIIDTDEILFSMPPRGRGQNTVYRFTLGKMEEQIDEVLGKCKGEKICWAVAPHLRSDACDEILKRRGFYLNIVLNNYYVSTSTLLSLPSVPDGYSLMRAKSAEDIRQYLEVSNKFFNNNKVVTDERVEHELSLNSGDNPKRFIYLIHKSPKEMPVSISIASQYPEKNMLYLCGAGTDLEYRHGGLYIASLKERAILATSLGLDHIITIGRSQTSGPILEKVGFKKYGQTDYWNNFKL